MKKLFVLLMTLCLLFTTAALAETPSFADMPAMVLLDSFFEGTWGAGTAFAGEVYLDLAELGREYSIYIPAVTIDVDEKVVIFEGESEYGEFFREEYPYTLENSQLECEDDEGHIFVFELLEDGNICMTTFVPGEGEGMLAITVFMVREAAE